MTTTSVRSLREAHSESSKRTRNTVQRRSVLETVRALGASHPTAAEIFVAVRERSSSLSLATVYRALDALVEQKAIGRSYVENVARYDVSAAPHHHVVCRLCGRVDDMNIPLPPSTIRRLNGAAGGFALELDAIQFKGVCPACRTDAK